jgi:hypothetical protein
MRDSDPFGGRSGSVADDKKWFSMELLVAFLRDSPKYLSASHRIRHKGKNRLVPEIALCKTAHRTSQNHPSIHNRGSNAGSNLYGSASGR